MPEPAASSAGGGDDGGAAALAAVFGSAPPPPILDCRPRPAFHDLRLAGSACIPAHELPGRLFLLPDKGRAFVLVEPAGGQQSAAERLEGAPSVAAFLTGRGWTVRAALLDGAQLWAAADALGVCERGAATQQEQQALRRRFLFAPAPLLAQSIQGIEAALAAAAGEQQQQHVWRALDIGCGSGRDVIWLACRHLGGGPAGCRWHVTGVDEWRGALQRVEELALAAGLDASGVELVQARVQSANGQFEPLPPPPAAADAASSGLIRTGPVHMNAAGGYHLIVCVRFLERALLPRLPELLAPGGHVLYCTWTDGPGLRAFGRPSGPSRVLQPGELAARFFCPGQGFSVVRDEVALSDDGRELSMFVARKLAGTGE